MTTRPVCRLYLITPPVIQVPEAFAAELDAALDGGDVACLQIRCKTAAGEIDAEMTRAVARAVTRSAQSRGVAVVINDSAALAHELGADGVHLGQTDGDVRAARAKLGPDAIIGVTCHDSRHLAMLAGEAGADYVAFGAFYPTQTKAPPAIASPDLLTWWQELMEIPCVAIGGIEVANAAPLIAAGADFLAVSAGVWQHKDGPQAAVRAFNALFQAAAAGGP